MPDEQPPKFTDLVAQQIEPDDEAVRRMWIRVAQEFDRGGPDPAMQLLSGDQQRLVENAESLLRQFEETE